MTARWRFGWSRLLWLLAPLCHADMYITMEDVRRFEEGQWQIGSEADSFCKVDWVGNVGFQILQAMHVLTTSKPDQCPWQHVGFGWVRHSLAENFDGLYGLSLAATLNMDFDEIMVTSNNCSRWFIMNPATSQIWSKDLAGKGNVCPGWGRCRLGDMLRLLSGQTIRWFIWVRKTSHQWGTCDFVESVFDTSCEPQPDVKWSIGWPAYLAFSTLKLLKALESVESGANGAKVTSVLQQVRQAAGVVRGCLQHTIWAPAILKLFSRPMLRPWRSLLQGAINMTAMVPSANQPWYDEAFQSCKTPSPCWRPMVGWISFESSCLLCCNPFFGPKGYSECFTEPFTYGLCCQGNQGVEVKPRMELNESSLTTLINAAPKTSKKVHHWRGKVLPVNWTEVELEVLRTQKPMPDVQAEVLLKRTATEMRSWMDEGRGQRVWPQVDLYVSQNVLTAADTWVLAEPDADGADLLFSNGYLCDQGCCPANASACALRQRSQPGTFAALPSDGPVEICDFGGSDAVMRAHAVQYGELPLPKGVACPRPSSGSVAVLLTQPGASSAGHALSEAIFLSSVLRMARLGAFQHKPLYVIPSLSRLWCCHCQQLVDATSSGDCILDSLSPPISPMDPNMKASNPLAYLVFQIALRFLPNQTVSWFSLFKDEVNGKDPNFACPRRYDAVVQPFRSLVGDASLHNEFRQHAAELCGLQEPPAVPKKRRLVLLRRTRHMRSWGDVEELLQGLLAWAKRNDWQVEVLTLGDMEPCEQIAALQDASIAITVYSTEHHLASAFLPEKAVLLVLNTKVKARLKKLEDLRGPGMQRNASVARRFVELCGPWRAAAEAREAKEADSGGSWEPVLAPFMDNSGTAAARNLMFYAFNNVTCHVLATSKKVVSRTPCGSDDLLVTGAVSTHWDDLIRVLDISLIHLRRFL